MSVQQALFTRSTAVHHRVSILALSQTGPSIQQVMTPSQQTRVQEVKAVLAKEHEHHGQGQMLLFSCQGRGKRASVGRAVEHVGNLSGEPPKEVLYSFFD